MKPDLDTFRTTLIRKREEAGLNIAQAARRAGMAANSWGNVERGYEKKGGTTIPSRPSLNFVRKAVVALQNWEPREAFQLAGYKPERLNLTEEPPPGVVMDTFNRLSKQRQEWLEWGVRLFEDEHAAFRPSLAPTPTSVPADSDERQHSRRRR